MDPVYFAAKPPAEIIKACGAKIDAHYEWLRTSGRLSLWNRSYEQYYAGQIEGGKLQSAGDQGELVAMNVNDFRNLGQHLAVMTTSQRPAFEPRAINADHKSQTQTILAGGILDYVLKEKGLEEAAIEAVEASLITSETFLAVDWDATKGRPVAADENDALVKSGDIAFRAYSPLDMVSDFTKTTATDHTWRIGRRWVNRYDLAAKHREFAEKLLQLPTVNDPKRPRYMSQAASGIILTKHESEDVELWTLYHDRTDAVPNGRLVVFCLGMEAPLFDGPLPFDDLGIYRMAPAPMLLSPHGYSPLFDLLSIQAAENALYSTVASNTKALGVQTLWGSMGDNVELTELFKGLNLIKSKVKPEALELCRTSPDVYRMLELVSKAMETISGVNSVARGNPEANLKSGAALALVQAQALQFSIGLQRAYVRFMEAVGTGVIRIYKRFAQAPQVAMITGKGNRGYLQEFTSSDLDHIDRVAVDMGNALSRTVAGRAQLADTWLERGLIKTIEQYQQVIATGRTEPIMEADQKEMLAIKSENERLSDGSNTAPPPPMPGAPPAPQPEPRVIAVITDNHPAHMREHAAVIASPESRENPAVVQSTTDHILEHMNLWVSMPPPLAMALNIPPPPMPQMAPPSGPNGPPSSTPPPPNGETSTTGPEPIAGPADATGPMPNMPRMPINPMTGERAPGPPAA